MSGTYGGVDLSMPGRAADSEVELVRGDLVTGGGAIDLQAVRVGALGLRAETGLGELTLQGVSARCNPLLLGQEDYNVDLRTDRGGISLRGSNFTDCDVQLRGSQSLVRVTDTVVRNSQGAGTLRLLGEQGLIELTDTDAQVYDVRGSAGSVRAYRPVVREAMRAATVSGSVRIEGALLDPRAVLQVETDSGEVRIHAKQFAGIVSIVTGGGLRCSGLGFDARDAQGRPTDPCTSQEDRVDGLAVVERVQVNCAHAGPGCSNDCPYLGELSITSQHGTVELVMDKWLPSGDRGCPGDDEFVADGNVNGGGVRRRLSKLSQ